MSQHGGGGFISEAIKVIERLCMKVNIEALTQAKDEKALMLRDQVNKLVGTWQSQAQIEHVDFDEKLEQLRQEKAEADHLVEQLTSELKAVQAQFTATTSTLQARIQQLQNQVSNQQASHPDDLDDSPLSPTIQLHDEGTLDRWNISETGIHEWTDQRGPYDEVYTSQDIASRKPRPAYRRVMMIMERIEEKQPERIDAFAEVSLKNFRGDNRMYHIPRMLTQVEAETIRNGVEQRARAIQAFLSDHYGAEKPAYKASKTLPNKVMRDILERNGEIHLKKQQLAQWGLWYGPDIVRGPDANQWYVVEDNLGYVGGFGDLVIARESLLASFPELTRAIAPVEPTKFYSDMAAACQKLAKGNKVVLLHYPKSATVDNEESRVVKLFRAHGIENVALPMYGKQKKNKPYLFATNEGVFYTKNSKSKREKVGLVIIDAEPFDVDPRHKSVKRKMVRDEGAYWLDFYLQRVKRAPAKRKAKIEAKIETLRELMQDFRGNRLLKFLRENHKFAIRESLDQGVPGLLENYFENRVKLVNGPGFDFLGDKEFCMHVDALIKFYLKEEPLLKSIPTKSFRPQNDTEKVNESLIRDVFDHLEAQQSVVLKRVDGRGGDSVWVGPKISVDEFQSVKELIIAEPQAFIAQRYIPLSHVDGQLVDLRNLSYLDHESVVVSDVLWGRGVPMAGSNGKVNISDAGFEFCVGVSQMIRSGSNSRTSSFRTDNSDKPNLGVRFSMVGDDVVEFDRRASVSTLSPRSSLRKNNTEEEPATKATAGTARVVQVKQRRTSDL